MADLLQFRAKNRTATIDLVGGNLKPMGHELLAAARLDLTGFSGPNLRGPLLDSAKAVLAPFKFVGQELDRAVDEAAELLGPAGVLVGAAGRWALAEVLIALFGEGRPAVPDSRILAGAGWQDLGTSDGFALRTMRAFGLLRGARIAGEILAALGWWVGPAGIGEVGGKSGVRLMVSRGGRVYVIVPRGVAASNILTNIPEAHRRPWMSTEDEWIIDLAQGHAYALAFDALLDEARLNLRRAAVPLLLHRYRDLSRDPWYVGRQLVAPEWRSFDQDLLWLGPFEDLRSPPDDLRDHVDKLIYEGAEPWQMRQMEAFGSFSYSERPYPTYPASSTGAKSMPGAGTPHPTVFRFGPAAPWERDMAPPPGEGRVPRVDQERVYLERWRRWGPALPAWPGPGTAALSANPLHAAGWSPIVRALNEVQEFADALSGAVGPPVDPPSSVPVWVPWAGAGVFVAGAAALLLKGR